MDERLTWIYGIALVIATFAIPAALLIVVERIPGLRVEDGSSSATAPSRSLGALMLAGGMATFALSVLPGDRYGPGVLLGGGLALMGASGFARHERRMRWLDRLGKLLMVLAFVLGQWLGSRT